MKLIRTVWLLMSERRQAAVQQEISDMIELYCNRLGRSRYAASIAIIRVLKYRYCYVVCEGLLTIKWNAIDEYSHWAKERMAYLEELRAYA